MQAIHGANAKHDPLAAQHMAGVLRGGMLPQASVYPAARRATRDRLRRRLPLTRQRAARRAHLQPTYNPYHLPAMGQTLADQANRAGAVARCADPAVQTRVAVDLALMGCEDSWLSDVEWPLVPTAKPHDAHTWERRPSVPGIGKMAMSRFPRVQACVS